MYCVYLTIYRGNLLPPFYIGSTKLSKIANGYNGSVSSKEYQSIWRYERRYNRHKFRTIILAEFSTHTEALQKEETLQIAVKAVENPLYVNKALANTKFKENRSGKKHSRSTRQKISEARKGKCTGYRDPKIGEKISSALFGHSVLPRTRRKLSQLNLGKKYPDRKKPPPMSEEQKRKISIAVKERKRLAKLMKSGSTIIDSEFSGSLNRLV